MQIIGDVPQLTVAFIRRKAPYFVGDSLTDSVTFWGVYAVLGKDNWRRRSPDDGRRLLGRGPGSAGGPYVRQSPQPKMAWFANQRERQALFLPPPLR